MVVMLSNAVLSELGGGHLQAEMLTPKWTYTLVSRLVKLAHRH